MIAIAVAALVLMALACLIYHLTIEGMRDAAGKWPDDARPGEDLVAFTLRRGAELRCPPPRRPTL